MKYVFSTNLSIQECRARLEANLDKPALMHMGLPNKLIGKISGDSFTAKIPRAYFFSKTPPKFLGKLEQQESGTIIRGSFSSFVAWVYVVSVIVVLGLIALATAELKYKLLTAAFLVLGSMFYWVTHKDQKDSTLQLLTSVLEIKE